MESSETPEADLRQYLAVLGRRSGAIIFAVFVVVVFALISIVLQSPIYQSSTSLLLKPGNSDNLLNPNANISSDPARDVQTELQVVTSAPVKQAVKAELGAAPDVATAVVGSTNVISVTAQSTDAATAATVANAYANAYISYRRTQNINNALAAESQIQARIDDLQHQIDALNSQLRSADARTQATLSASLAPQIDSLLTQQATLKQQLSQIQVSASVSSAPAQVVNPATPSGTPIRPRPVRDLGLAIFAGLLLGAGAAFTIEFLDDSVKTRADLEKIVPGVPTVAVIPHVSTWRAKEEAVLMSLVDPHSPPAESYRSLRTAIQFTTLDRPLRTLQVTSASPGEGKTTTLANLGVALSQVGLKVILACCDLRRPRLHEFFGLENAIGFTSVYLGEIPAIAALQSVPNLINLRVLPSGPLPPNPAELLSSERTQEVLLALQGDTDIVLIDSPPVIPVTDPAVISRVVDGTLLVVRAGVTTRSQVVRAVSELNQVGAPLIGTVLNGLGTQGPYGYGYRYYRYERESTRRWDLGSRSIRDEEFAPNRKRGAQPSTTPQRNRAASRASRSDAAAGVETGVTSRNER